MQMIEVNNVIMLELGPVKKISDKACIFWDFDADCIFDCPHRGQSMGVRSDPAGALNKMVGVTGIAAL
jgi:hypothetical protein